LTFVYYLFGILYCTLGLAFSACEALQSSTADGTTQIFAVTVIVTEYDISIGNWHGATFNKYTYVSSLNMRPKYSFSFRLKCDATKSSSSLANNFGCEQKHKREEITQNQLKHIYILYTTICHTKKF